MTGPPDESDRAPTSSPPAAYHSAQFANVVAAVHDLKHPTQIGPYVIVQMVGEGGMGTVYKAEQREPVRRVVALKLIKLGMDTREVIARFQSERQALALMSHPNVANVLDAGATETGRPYFVMEYVQGEPITTFADRHKLTVRQRLELFTQACDAVQHAHQKAIIHRDLKPSNILVTLQGDKPWVKVIDFGVAKAVSQRLTEKTFFTETGQLVGTPEYMAPEQADAAMLDIDTRSDVYSLGVVLYELLSGALPFDAPDLRSRGYQEIQRIIREVDPPRPSTRLSRLGARAQEIARLRQTPLESLERQLKSELEWIPLKAMRKERAQRYASAAELAHDVGNYLSNRPLFAGPESAAYRLRKFLRRNKAGVVASATMFLLLVAGIIATTWQAVRARRAEQKARIALKKAEDANANTREVNRFLTDDLLASAAPEVTRGKELSVRQAVDRAADSVAQRFRDHPLTEAAIRSVLADTYHSLGYTERALAHAQAALEILRQARGPDDPETIDAAREVGNELSQLNRHGEAEPMLRDALERSRRLLGEDHPVTLNCMGSLAMTLRMQEKFAEAEPLFRKALDGDRRVHGPKSLDTAQSLNGLAVLLNTQGRAAEAEPLYREALEIRGKLLGEDHPAYLTTQSNLARVLEAQGKTDETVELERHVLSERRRVLGDDHPATMLLMNNLASMLARQQKYQESEELHREALSRRLRALGEDDPDTLQSMSNLGHALILQGKYAQAEDLLRTAVEKRKKVLGPRHANTLGSMSSLSNAYEHLGRLEDAEPLLAELCQADVLAKLNPEQQAAVVARFGCCLARLTKFAEAEPVLLDARRRLGDAQSSGQQLREVLAALADVCDHTTRPDEAVKWRAELAKLPTTTSAAR